MEIITLAEWETKIIPGLELTREDQAIVAQLGGEAGRLDIEELRTGLKIQAKSWVGVIRFHKFEVQVIPKLAGKNLGLVEMLMFTSGLDALRRNSGVRELQTENTTNLFDLLCLLLSEYCERIVSGGLRHDYVEEECDLPFLRGRLLVRDQIRKRMGQIDRLECHFDEHNTDILDNRVLAAVLMLCAKQVTHPLVTQKIRRLTSIFAEACSTENLNLCTAWDDLSYDRQNQHYQAAHTLARILSEGFGVQDLFASSEIRSFAFLLDMNRLFELFMYRFLERALSGSNYHVYYQFRDPSIIWDADHNRPYTHVIPDLLVENNGIRQKRMVMDVKYKLYDDGKVNPSDIYQCFLYAYAYKRYSSAIPMSVILYPSERRLRPGMSLEVRTKEYLTGAKVHILGINIPQAIEEINVSSLGDISKYLQEIIYSLDDPAKN
jgi:5-methylcytosine-specific restriction enzyme subunit McrC